MGGEYLFWEGKETFRGFCDFRGFRVIDLARNLYYFLLCDIIGSPKANSK